MAHLVDIPITTDHWEGVIRSTSGAGVLLVSDTILESTEEGLSLAASDPSYYRQTHFIRTKQVFDVRGSVLYVKWKAICSGYGGWGVTLGFAGIAAGFTSGHSWNGSIVLTCGTWYYTRSEVLPNAVGSHTVYSYTTTENYDDNGGTPFHAEERDFSTVSEQYNDLSTKTLEVHLNDVYSSDGSYKIVLGEAKIAGDTGLEEEWAMNSPAVEEAGDGFQAIVSHGSGNGAE